MTGVVGLGQRVMAGRAGPEAAAKAAAFDRLGLRVTPANVLGVYGAIQEEVMRLRTSVNMFQTRFREGMPRLGEDLVSPYASRGFTEVTQELLARCQADIDDLVRVAEGLAQAARAYGKTEQQLAAAFDRSKFRYEPSPIPAGGKS